MIKTNSAFISNITLQKVGNKLKDELSFVAKEELTLKEDEKEALEKFFFRSVRSEMELMKFNHHISLEHNIIYDRTQKFWNNEIDFLLYSHHVLSHLYEKTNHPQIKSGELFVVQFDNLKFEDLDTVKAIGIFKVENKIEYLNFHHGDELTFQIKKGAKLQKIDKGCLIVNTFQDDGFRIISVDNNNYDATYWKKDFLGLENVQNDDYQTKHNVNLLSSFSATLIEETDSYKQKEFISKGVQLFEENEIITQEILKEELLEPFQVIDEYETFKSNYKKEHQLEDIEDSFSVSQTRLKKERRKIKNEIKLDTNIQIKLDLNDVEFEENVEKGFDENRKMHYYKVYYNQEY